MRNILIVLKHELITTLSRPSFWVMTFLFPALVVFITIGTQVITQKNVEEMESTNPLMGGSQAAGGERYAYVDLAGIIQKVPEQLPPEMLVKFQDESSAQEALQAKEIESYALIPSDYLETGEIRVVQRVFNPMAKTPEGFFQYLAAYNLAPDARMAPILSGDTPSTILHNVAPSDPAEPDGPQGMGGMVVAYGTMFIFFMLISMSSSLMLNSVSKEKSNRVAEVLLLSLRPRELMAGKLFGLSFVAIFQMAAWLGGILLFLEQGRNMISGLSQINLPPGFVIWAVLYFFFGYLLYASLMGAIGALAPDLREAGQFTFILLLPIMLPLFLIVPFSEEPNGTLATILSLFPFTAPTAMMTRLASAPVPFWQPAASLVGLAIATYLVLMLSGRFFHPETLLSSASLKWSSFLPELRRAIKGS